MRLEEITASLVNTAIEDYLQVAYGDAVSRDKHALKFPPDKPLAEILTEFVSENTPSAQAWSLRLGSDNYPHMKLVLRGTCFPGEYVFTVDRHDCFKFTTETEGLQKWNELQIHNYALKKQIEEIWHTHDLPTLRRVRERLTDGRPMSPVDGQDRNEVLIIDNDPDAGELFGLIIADAGFKVCRAESIASAHAFLEDTGHNFTVAVVDMVLEDGCGQDLVTFMRSNPRTTNLPTVVITGMPEDSIPHREVFDSYLRKPFSADALLAEIRRNVAEYSGD